MILPVFNLKHHETFWFPDANIILLANDGQTAFQVHRGVLCRKSKVFADMMAVPQPQSQETVNGLPVVRLSEKADDIAIFLGLLYDGWT